MDYNKQMQALTQMAQLQSKAQERKARGAEQGQMLRHLGSFMDVATRPVATQAEIMAKQVPTQPSGLGDQWRQAAQGMEQAGARGYQDLLDRYKMQDKTMLTMAKLKQYEQSKADRELDRRYKEAMIKGKEAETQQLKTKPKKLTKGQEKVDTEFGKEWSDYSYIGNKAGIEKNLSQLNKVKTALENEIKKPTRFGVSGKAIGGTPDALKPYLFPEAVNVQEMIAEVAQGNLRATLGPQFTQKEGELIIMRAYNEKLPEKMNLERVNRLMSQIIKRKNALEASGRYFDKHGTLVGYKGVRPEDVKIPRYDLEGQGGMSVMPEAVASEREETRTYGGKTYRLKPGTDRTKKENWEVIK